MRIGASFPHEVTQGDRGRVRTVAAGAEGLGAHHLRLYDHVLGSARAGRETILHPAFDETSLLHEAMVLAGFLAAVTEQIELALGVLVLPQRPIALAAKQLAEVSLLSDGRLRLGVGAGWNEVEFEALGAHFAGRGVRLDEQLDVLRALWAGEVVDIAGRWHRLDRVAMAPRPHQPLALWVGGFGPAAWDRAVRAGDGFVAGASLDDAARSVGEVRHRLRIAGRDPDRFGFDVLVHATDNLDAWCRDHDRARDELGATHVTISLPRDQALTPDRWLRLLGRALDAVR